ncbi:MAG: hypothetical protein RL375_253 [Pseudomonadota bacterium]
MCSQRTARRLLPALLLLLAMLGGCATSSTPTPAPPPVDPPAIPAPPPVQEPPASGEYWTAYCATIERLSAQLRITLPTFGRCSGPGPRVGE